MASASPRPAKRRSLPLRSISLVALALLAGGCSMLQPHVPIPQRLLVDKSLLACDDPQPTGPEQACATLHFYGDLPEAIAGTNELRSRYLEAMRSETALSNGLLAALIPLSAAALYHGVSSSGEHTQRLVLRAGIVGAAGYAGVTTFASKPRQQLYLAGAEALGCALVASRPYLLPTREMGDADTTGTLLGDLATLQALTAGLEPKVRGAQARVDAMAGSRESNRTAGTRAAPGTALPPLTDPNTLSHPEDAQTLRSANDQLLDGARRANSKPARTAAVPVGPPELARARSALAGAHRALDRGLALRARIDAAGDQLRGQALKVYSQVSREILNTTPDPASIFSVVGSMPQNALRLSGAKTASVPTAQSSVATFSAVKEDERAQLANDAQSLVEASAAVTAWVDRVDAMAAGVGKLAECRFEAPGSALQLVPDVTEVEMAAGSSMSFKVSGGSGTPRMTIVGAQGGAAVPYEPPETKVDTSGTYVATFKLKTSALPSDRPIIVFSDGAGALTRQVVVSIVADGGAASGGLAALPSAPAAAPAPAPAASAGSAAPLAPVAPRAPASAAQPAANGACDVARLRSAMALPPGGRDDLFDRSIVNCKRSRSIAPADASLDALFCTRVIVEKICQ
jgi:hypothetical protein